MSQSKPCPSCADPNCTSGMDELREFKHWNDLVDHAGEDEIVKWVNAYARHKITQAGYHKSYAERNKALARAALQLLDPDELAELKRQAGLRAAARLAEREEGR